MSASHQVVDEVTGRGTAKELTTLECKSGGNGISQRELADQWHRLARSRLPSPHFSSLVADDKYSELQVLPRQSVFNPRPVHSGFSRVGIVPDDAVGWRVFSGSPVSPAPCHSGAAPYSRHFAFIASQDLDKMQNWRPYTDLNVNGNDRHSSGLNQGSSRQRRDMNMTPERHPPRLLCWLLVYFDKPPQRTFAPITKDLYAVLCAAARWCSLTVVKQGSSGSLHTAANQSFVERQQHALQPETVSVPDPEVLIFFVVRLRRVGVRVRVPRKALGFSSCSRILNEWRICDYVAFHTGWLWRRPIFIFTGTGRTARCGVYVLTHRFEFTSELGETVDDISGQTIYSSANYIYFSLVIDESCDVADNAQFLVFVKCTNDSFGVFQELLEV
ncbi:hypothetical protein PR048_006012 [Dryococelus australis]|uniref:Uncharacterized protein n=1 Tax=Dryococelus australis TaxID=614101 RepID=A0ABQ9IAR9_9NEOP|nr:hypothetical protein PR048_006012 [Dryococelus australis]